MIAGQGTLGLEMLSQTPDVDVVITAIGGGGLISGMACALKEINPRIRVIGVQTSRLPSMKAAIDAGTPGHLAGSLHPGRWHCRAHGR